MRITVASYNIHKAVGLDRKRDPERIMTILREIDADVIAQDRHDALRIALAIQPHPLVDVVAGNRDPHPR